MLLPELLRGYRLILASQSPRRKELLAGLDVEFEIILRPDISEDFPSGMDKFEIPDFLARAKSDAYFDLLTDKTK
jgi:septum formation protein